jgi:hypothetical protein
MDLSKYNSRAASDAGAPCRIKMFDGSGELTDITITLRGKDSVVFKQVTQAHSRARLKAYVPGQKMPSIDPAQIERESIQLLAALTISWENVEDNGKPIPCDEVTAEALYTDNPWIAEQVDVFVGDRANFLRSSQTTSAPSLPSNLSSTAP